MGVVLCAYAVHGELQIQHNAIEVVATVGFSPFWLMLPGLRAQLLDQSILLNFSLETRIEPKYFEPLIDFLAFLIQKL